MPSNWNHYQCSGPLTPGSSLAKIPHSSATHVRIGGTRPLGRILATLTSLGPSLLDQQKNTTFIIRKQGFGSEEFQAGPRSSRSILGLFGAFWGIGSSWKQLGHVGALGASCDNPPKMGAFQSLLGAFWDYMEVFGDLWRSLRLLRVCWVFVGCFLKLQGGV